MAADDGGTMDEERDLGTAATLDRRLALAAEALGWGASRIAAFRAGYAESGADGARLWRHLPEAGYDESRLTPAEVDSLGYRDGFEAREAARAQGSDLPGADALVLMEHASVWAGNADGDVDVTEAQWRCEAAAPLGPFLSVMGREDWARWVAQEHADAIAEGRPGYGHLLVQDIRDPVVYVETADGIDVWDGCHRIGMAMLKGAGSIPVLAGTLPAPVPAP